MGIYTFPDEKLAKDSKQKKALDLGKVGVRDSIFWYRMLAVENLLVLELD